MGISLFSVVDYRPVPQRIISIEPTDDRTCFQGIIIDDVIGLEDVESFTLSIELPAQDGVELGLDISTINIIDDDGRLRVYYIMRLHVDAV